HHSINTWRHLQIWKHSSTQPAPSSAASSKPSTRTSRTWCRSSAAPEPASAGTSTAASSTTSSASTAYSRCGTPPAAVCLCGLYHSAYSNSYVNLAIFPPSAAGRDTVRSHVGPAAESLIHLFCVVPRQQLIFDNLLFRYTDAELVDHLRSSAAGEIDSQADWRVRLESVCPAEGIKVKHIKTGEDVVLPRRIVAVFLLLTMADFSDQWFGFQDKLFDNVNGRLEFSGNENSLWPGDGKPGLWFNSVSRMGAIYKLIAREEEIVNTNNYNNKNNNKSDIIIGDDDVELVVPPVFEGCEKIVDAKDGIMARDLYWEAVCGGGDAAEGLLLESVEKNPFVGEAHVVLSQIYLGKGEFEAAERAAERGLRLMMEWGSPWDKRMTWQGWIAWGRVLRMKAKEKSWPQDAFGLLNLGLVI
ncbi:hypothetical protein PHJA_002461700, partial [Phtheirospermum japonicum]